MSAINSSSGLNADPPPLSPTNDSSVADTFFDCTDSVASVVLYTSYTMVSVLLLLPLYVFIVYTGFQRSRCRGVSPAGATTSHSDFFTYHMMVVEFLGVFGSFFYTLGSFLLCRTVTLTGVYVFSIIFPGQTLFHMLTSVDCYLAVVHPITYMRLRETCGIWIRNVSVLCAWGVSLGWLRVTKLYIPSFPTIPLICCLAVCICFMSFCCLSVIYVLTLPGPGKVGSPKVNLSKQRACHMITAINGVLLLRILGLLLCFVLGKMVRMDHNDMCTLLNLGLWLTLPSSLLLPLLFLHRAGKLPFCRKTSGSGQRVK